jgi:REP-associated tyrosine transposase
MARYPYHLRGFDYIGRHRYSLTFCCYDRREVFRDASAVDLVQVQILRAAEDQQFALIVFCFMPDHLHLLVEGQRDTSNLKRFQIAAKQFSAFHYRRCFGAALWQRYAYDRVLRPNEPTAVVARYILGNPVRAGLAVDIADYPFSGSGVLSMAALIESVRAG